MKNFEYATYNGTETWEFPECSAFEDWLDRYDPRLLLSRDWTTRGCPMWFFLRSEGWSNHLVHPTGEWTPDSDLGDRFQLPGWAAEFVWWSFNIKPREMTVSDCFNLLDNPCYRPAAWEDGKVRILLRTL